LRGSSLSRSVLTGNRIILVSVGAVILLQMLFTYAPWMNRLFDSAPLAASHWLLIAGLGLALFAIVEAEKAVVRRLKSAR
ncbi:MAG: P-type ATPase, translocating, partial [Proteobacteria bacterium]|nr:P-type ATPase, translocating [Pseudomonadota bacterium]